MIISTAAFSDTVLSSHDDYQGVLFFPVIRESSAPDGGFRAIVLFNQKILEARRGYYKLDTEQRINFGPISVGQ